ncbi:MAG: hypothetical protein GF317_19100 [Candidatus Lokiarchaeota archaeon]|nr:hypothetical protein [Candidatus Lokiarchaeota archaeon]MBD3201620.1 hypothetical protein [Candidatus Lokiarchaeota archaeon]
MSKPASLRVGPFVSNVLVKKRYLVFYAILIVFSIFIVQFEFWLFWIYFFDDILIFFILLPFLVLLIYASLVVVSLLIAKALLVIVGMIHKPQEGVFMRDNSDKNYRYWNIRNVIKKWPVWLSHKFPYPIFDNLCLKVFGVSTNLKNSLFEGWIDTEFIEFGKNVVIGEGSIIQSMIIAGNLFIIRKTIIEDNVRIGAHSIVMPGTHIEKDCILAASSTTTVNQRLEEGWIYIGVPAKKYRKNEFFKPGIENLIGDSKDLEKLKQKYDMIYTKRIDKE